MLLVRAASDIRLCFWQLPLWIGRMAGVETFTDLELDIGLFHLSHLAVQLTEQEMKPRICLIQRNGSLHRGCALSQIPYSYEGAGELLMAAHTVGGKLRRPF